MSKFLKLPEETKLTSECQEKVFELVQALSSIGHVYDKFMESGWLDRDSMLKAHDSLKRAREKNVVSFEEANSISNSISQAMSDATWRNLHRTYDKSKFIELFGNDIYEKTRFISGGEIESNISDAEQVLLATLLEKVVECECRKKL